MLSDHSNSFLDELRGLVGALNDAKVMINGRAMLLWIDSQSVFKRLTGNSTKPKRLMGKRVSRLLAWLWSNYLLTQMSMRFVLGLKNGMADVISRWGVKTGTPRVKQAD